MGDGKKGQRERERERLSRVSLIFPTEKVRKAVNERAREREKPKRAGEGERGRKTKEKLVSA